MTDKFALKTAEIILTFLTNLMHVRISISGKENLSPNPTIFVANHFTRAETLILPYILYREFKKPVRSLAHHDVFIGRLGRYLRRMGALPTNEPERNQIILNDITTGSSNWLIYPEGSMVKNKKIIGSSKLYIETPDHYGAIFTGASVLAMQAELKRRNKSDLSLLPTMVVPITITYYPLRTGDNRIKHLAEKYLHSLEPRVAEELEIEGNLILGSEIDLHFNEPINVSNHIDIAYKLVNKLPFIEQKTKDDLVLNYFRHKMTSKFMNEIYSNIKINLDHIFALIINNANFMTHDQLRLIIIKSISDLIKTKQYRVSDQLNLSTLHKFLNDERHEALESVIQLAKDQKILIDQDGGYIIDRVAWNLEHDFHQVRIKNTLRVIANEANYLAGLVSIVKNATATPVANLQKSVFDLLLALDQKNFAKDYDTHYDKVFSKPRNICAPFFLAAAKSCGKLPVLLVHGYKSAPEEMRKLADFLSLQNHDVYVARLKGHGTAPIELATTSHEDWYNSLDVGYAILRAKYPKLALIGFSTGGLLSILATVRKNNANPVLITANAALKLHDIRTKMVGAVNLWNDLLNHFNTSHGKLEYIDDKPENPEINYSRNYIYGVTQIAKLMSLCHDSLHQVTTKTMVIQSLRDPTVNPKSGELLFNKILSDQKLLITPDLNYHTILTRTPSQELFTEIAEFLI